MKYKIRNDYFFLDLEHDMRDFLKAGLYYQVSVKNRHLIRKFLDNMNEILGDDLLLIIYEMIELKLRRK